MGRLCAAAVLVSIVLVIGARIDGLRINSVLGPILGLLMLLLGEPVYLSLYIVIASLLTGVLCGYAWGYYLAPPVLAVVFSLPGPAGTDTLQFLATLISAVWIARRIPEKHLKHFAHLVPGTQASQRQAKGGHDEHLKQVLGEKSINTSPF